MERRYFINALVLLLLLLYLGNFSHASDANANAPGSVPMASSPQTYSILPASSTYTGSITVTSFPRTSPHGTEPFQPFTPPASSIETPISKQTHSSKSNSPSPTISPQQRLTSTSPYSSPPLTLKRALVFSFTASTIFSTTSPTPSSISSTVSPTSTSPNPPCLSSLSQHHIPPLPLLLSLTIPALLLPTSLILCFFLLRARNRANKLTQQIEFDSLRRMHGGGEDAVGLLDGEGEGEGMRRGRDRDRNRRDGGIWDWRFEDECAGVGEVYEMWSPVEDEESGIKGLERELAAAEWVVELG